VEVDEMNGIGVRAVRLVLTVLLVSGAVGLGASPARAQYSTTLCKNAADVLQHFSNYEFGGYPACESLCNRVHADCKKYLARSRSCERASVNDGIVYVKKAICDTLGDAAARKACRQSYDESAASAKDDIDTEYQVARDDCAVIRNECMTQCD
jgi:hypothetical protein